MSDTNLPHAGAATMFNFIRLVMPKEKKFFGHFI
jgi:hypothetical protein